MLHRQQHNRLSELNHCDYMRLLNYIFSLFRDTKMQWGDTHLTDPIEIRPRFQYTQLGDAAHRFSYDNCPLVMA